MAKVKRAKYFTRNFSTYTIYGRVVRTAKIKLHENLSHEIFLTRKFRDLRYVAASMVTADTQLDKPSTVTLRHICQGLIIQA